MMSWDAFNATLAIWHFMLIEHNISRKHNIADAPTEPEQMFSLQPLERISKEEERKSAPSHSDEDVSRELMTRGKQILVR